MKPLKKLKNHFRVFEKVLSGSPQQSAAFLRKYKNGKLLYVPDAHYCYYLEDEVAIILAQKRNFLKHNFVFMFSLNPLMNCSKPRFWNQILL